MRAVMMCNYRESLVEGSVVQGTEERRDITDKAPDAFFLRH